MKITINKGDIVILSENGMNSTVKVATKDAFLLDCSDQWIPRSEISIWKTQKLGQINRHYAKPLAPWLANKL